jgi:hypothetical protein
MIELLKEWEQPGFWGHVPYSAKMEQFLYERFDAIIFIRRHPFDIALSWAHYIDKYPQGTLSHKYPDQRNMHQFPISERLYWIMDMLGPQMNQYTGWIRDSVYQVQYEDMFNDSIAVWNQIHSFLASQGIDIRSGDDMAEASSRKHKLTWHKGTTGRWKDEFTPGHIKFGEQRLGHIIKDWGYQE